MTKLPSWRPRGGAPVQRTFSDGMCDCRSKGKGHRFGTRNCLAKNPAPAPTAPPPAPPELAYDRQRPKAVHIKKMVKVGGPPVFIVECDLCLSRQTKPKEYYTSVLITHKAAAASAKQHRSGVACDIVFGSFVENPRSTDGIGRAAPEGPIKERPKKRPKP
jgi:hypothetical protein